MPSKNREILTMLKITTTKKSFKFYFILWCVVAGSLIILRWFQYQYYYTPIVIAQTSAVSDEESKLELLYILNSRPKYVLLWTDSERDPISNLREGVETFDERGCAVSNCYVTDDRTYFDKLTDFDVIVFHAPNVNINDLPKERSPFQKYIFASMESSSNYPICSSKSNDFFNWTWTYKIHSDLMYGYICIRDNDNKIVGPKEDMHWLRVEEMLPIDDILKEKLRRKKHAAAWFVSHCETQSKREKVADELTLELAAYNLTLDIYGRCGSKKCDRHKMQECLRMLETDYFFYLSFENSLDDDYVTEKILHALQHYTVPIVFGGANYTRFMPDGIYLNAFSLSVSELAKQMAELIADQEKYHNYFRWHNHYSYHYVEDSPDTDPYCKFCAMINDKKSYDTSVHPNFTEWWNPAGKCH